MGITKYYWRETVEVLARHTQELDAKEVWFLLKDAYPRFNFEDIPIEVIEKIIEEARKPIDDDEFYKNIKLIDKRRIKLLLRHQDIHSLYVTFKETLTRLGNLDFKHHFIMKEGHYYQISAIFDAKEEGQNLTTMVTTASLSAVSKMKRLIKAGKVKKEKVIFMTVFFRKIDKMNFETLVKELKEAYPNQLITHSFMETDGRVQVTENYNSENILDYIDNWKQFITRHRFAQGEKLIVEFARGY